MRLTARNTRSELTPDFCHWLQERRSIVAVSCQGQEEKESSVTEIQHSQSYSDVYLGGIPLILEFAYRFNPNWSAYAGIGFPYFPSKTFDFSNIQVERIRRFGDRTISSSTRTAVVKAELDDLYRIPIFVGGAYHFSEVTDWSLAPYVRADVGWIIQPAIDITFTSPQISSFSQGSEFWDTSVLALIDVGMGVESRLNSLGVFGIRLQYSTAPRGKLPDPSNSTGLLAVPLFLAIDHRQSAVPSSQARRNLEKVDNPPSRDE